LKIDMDCWLVTALEGYRVQGWRGPSFTESGDLRIDLSNRPTTSDPASRLGHTAITRDGQLRIRLSDGTDYVHAQIALIAPPAPQHLRHDAQGLYTVDAPDLMDLATKALPRTSILMAEGFLDPRYLTPELRAWIRRSISLNQRPLSLTGVLSHLAISGPGYFILRDAKSNQTYFTRSGYFQWSGDGYLEGIHGWRVQGWDINDDSPRSVDVRTSTHQRPSPTQTIRINWDGQVTEDDGTGNLTANTRLPRPTSRTQPSLSKSNRLTSQLPPDRVWFSEPFDSTPGWLPARSFPAGSIQQGALELFWYSEPFLTEDLPTNGRQLKAFGVQGTSALIQVSSDFQHWANWMMLDDWDNSVRSSPSEINHPPTLFRSGPRSSTANPRKGALGFTG
jgi:flagellar basal body rod protein FlgG